MEFRPIKLPIDLEPLGKMICDAFQYPENPQWSMQLDEKEDVSHTIFTYRRLWPVMRVAQLLSPPMRDMFRGYVAVEDGRIIGSTIIQLSLIHI